MHNYLRITLIITFITCLAACQQQPADEEMDKSAQQTETVAQDTGEDTGEESSDRESIHVLFFGDSITAGYGLELEQAFPALIQDKLDALSWPVRVTNAGLSGETSSGGLNRIDWLLRQPVDVFILELGGNDGLRGISLDLTEKNLQDIIDRVKQENPNVSLVIAGMQIPPNLGQAYTDQFKNLFPLLAEENSATLIPFILDGVAGIESLNLPDGIHPTAEGHKIIAETVWDIVSPVIDMQMQSNGCTPPDKAEDTLEGDCEIQHDIFE